MTLAELIAAVYVETKRADLTSLTAQAVKESTLECHHLDFFPRDLFETGVAFADEEYIQQLDISVIPRYRAIKYLRKSDSAGVVVQGETGKFTVITPDQILDDYFVELSNVAYVAGAVINFKSSTSFQYMGAGFYQHPDITDGGFSSWIAENFPYLIINKAAQKVFKRIGKDAEAAGLDASIQQKTQQLYSSNVTDVGS